VADSLRIVIQVEGPEWAQAKVSVTAQQLELIQQTTDQKNLAQWAAEELSSIISCLEDLGQ
jgi:hypothetical protein